jgi:hypothetical protein
MFASRSRGQSARTVHTPVRSDWCCKARAEVHVFVRRLRESRRAQDGFVRDVQGAAVMVVVDVASDGERRWEVLFGEGELEGQDLVGWQFNVAPRCKSTNGREWWISV